LGELLRIENISKCFGDHYANRNISLHVNEGEILTLLGENGAGKSTLMNILSGLYAPTSGEIFIRGQKVSFASSAEAVKAGVGMVHQHFMLVEAMTMFENIILGERKSSGVFIKKEDRRKEIEALQEEFGLQVDLDRKVTEASVGERQRAEILKALYHGADLLILDEPSAALTDIEVKGLYLIMSKLALQGKGIIFISHKLREVLYISDRVAILRAGELVDTVKCEDITAQELAAKMIGREIAETHYEKKISEQDEVLCLEGITYHPEKKHNSLRDVSFKVRAGEIVGIAGVDGNGQTQLAQVISGVLTPQAGIQTIGHQKVNVFDPHDIITRRVSSIHEDRLSQGLVKEMSVADNLVLRDIEKPQFSRFGGLSLKDDSIRSYAETMAGKYDIRLNDVAQPASDLSGGNQQKIILAREIESKPELLVAAHPTRGLDVGATRFIHDCLTDARDKGAGVLLISADFDEILEVSDRILVMFEGRIMGEFPGKNPSVEEISLAMTGKFTEKEGATA